MQIHPSQKEEKKHLESTLNNVNKEHKRTEKQVKRTEETYMKRLKNIDIEPADTKEEALKDLRIYLEGRGHELTVSNLDALEYQLKKPYFGRIVFKPNGKYKDLTNEYDVYIGRYNFINNTPNKTVIDWRAPVASLFYCNLSGNDDTKFELNLNEPGTRKKIEKVVEGNLTLRRRFDIKDAQLLEIHDASEEVNVLSDIIDDRAGGVLETIIESIQSEQDEIIRSKLNTPIIVQGTAGSGKTTIAVHKISYLIYTHNDILNQGNILLLLNSPILRKYVQSALEDLDVKNGNIYSLKHAVITKLDKFNDGYQFAQHNLTSDTSYDFDYAKGIKNVSVYCDKFSKELAKEVEKIIKKCRLRDVEIDDDLPIFENIHQIAVDIDNQHKYEIEKEELKKNPNFDRPKYKKMKIAYDSLKLLQKDFMLTEEFEKFLKAFNYNINNLDQTYVYLMFIFADKLWGDVIPGGKYAYTIVDEGQDYHDFEYEIITRLTHNGRLSIFGDIFQNTADIGIGSNWDRVKSIINNQFRKSPTLYNLPISYRNTKEVAELNRSMLCNFYDNDYLPIPYSRQGTKPTITNFRDKSTLFDILGQDLARLSKGDFKSACVILLNDSDLNYTNNHLQQLKITVEPITKTIKEFKANTIYLSKDTNIKGLEFSNVFIIGPTDKLQPSDFQTAKKLYVLNSRAINGLWVYGY